MAEVLISSESLGTRARRATTIEFSSKRLSNYFMSGDRFTGASIQTYLVRLVSGERTYRILEMVIGADTAARRPQALIPDLSKGHMIRLFVARCGCCVNDGGYNQARARRECASNLRWYRLCCDTLIARSIRRCRARWPAWSK